MEKAMLGIALRDRKRSTWINNNRWTKRLTDWHPYNEKRSRKRPDTKWRDEIEKFTGVAWQRLARDRQFWKELGKAFVQQ